MFRDVSWFREYVSQMGYSHVIVHVVGAYHASGGTVVTVHGWVLLFSIMISHVHLRDR